MQILPMTSVTHIRILSRSDWPSGCQDIMKLISYLHSVQDLFYIYIYRQRDSGSTQFRSPEVSTERSFPQQASFLSHSRWEHGEGSYVEGIRLLLGQVM